MSDRAAAIAYLLPPTGSFWEWVDDGRSLAWKSGETIAFWQEVLAVVQRLAPAGLPSFAAIVLLLAAARDGWTATSKHLAAHAEQLSSPGGGDTTTAVGVTLRAIGHRLGSDTANLIKQLDAIAGLPADLRHPLNAKAVLAEVLFEGGEPAILPDVSQQVVVELHSNTDLTSTDLVCSNGTALRELIAAIDSLKKGTPQVDADQLRLRLRTGLEQKIQPPAEDLGPSKRVHHLLGELANDPELGGLSRIARRLLAAVQVPRTLRRQQEMPTGGVADISNRGQLDRLLISELAHDDLTLAVRVAVNEALYLQRESPPQEPPRRRILLIDSGIRLWGVPRVYAAAVALALAATGDDLGDLQAFRPQGQTIVPVDLTTHEGIVSHLEVLDTQRHCGPALQAFTDEFQRDGDPCEAFLITHEDVLDDPAFRLAMRQQPRLERYAATVARDGTFRLWSITTTGRTMLRQATLDLDELLEPTPRPKEPLIDLSANLPVILGIRPFPLLLPPGTTARRMISGRDGLRAAVKRDRRLLVWRDDQAARQLTDHLPTGKLDLFRFSENGQTIIAVFTVQKTLPICTLCVTDLHTDSMIVVHLTGIDEPPLGMALHEDTLFVIGRSRLLAYGLTNGELKAFISRPPYRWRGGRVFRRSSQHFVLAYTGTQLCFEPIDIPPGNDAFEVAGVGGLLWISSVGQIYTASPERRMIVPGLGHGVIYEGVTADATTIVVRTTETKSKRYFCNPAEAKWRETSMSACTLLNCDSQHWLPAGSQHHHVRNGFGGVGVSEEGSLLLQSDSGYILALVMQDEILKLERGAFALRPKMQSFESVPSPKGRGYRLRAATFQSIPQVFLDSRGLLHLKSKEKSLPEISLVLSNGPVAGWSSDGSVYGPNYFHEVSIYHPASDLYNLIRRFTERLQ